MEQGDTSKAGLEDLTDNAAKARAQHTVCAQYMLNVKTSDNPRRTIDLVIKKQVLRNLKWVNTLKH